MCVYVLKKSFSGRIINDHNPIANSNCILHLQIQTEVVLLSQVFMELDAWVCVWLTKCKLDALTFFAWVNFALQQGPLS